MRLVVCGRRGDGGRTVITVLGSDGGINDVDGVRSCPADSRINGNRLIQIRDAAGRTGNHRAGKIALVYVNVIVIGAERPANADIEHQTPVLSGGAGEVNGENVAICSIHAGGFIRGNTRDAVSGPVHGRPFYWAERNRRWGCSEGKIGEQREGGKANQSSDSLFARGSTTSHI